MCVIAMVSAKDTAPAPTGKTAEGANISLPSETMSFVKKIRAETHTETETDMEQRQRQKDKKELLKLLNRQEIDGKIY